MPKPEGEGELVPGIYLEVVEVGPPDGNCALEDYKPLPVHMR